MTLTVIITVVMIRRRDSLQYQKDPEHIETDSAKHDEIKIKTE